MEKENGNLKSETKHQTEIVFKCPACKKELLIIVRASGDVPNMVG